jgi:hypothetical protein
MISCQVNAHILGCANSVRKPYLSKAAACLHQHCASCVVTFQACMTWVLGTTAQCERLATPHTPSTVLDQLYTRVTSSCLPTHLPACLLPASRPSTPTTSEGPYPTCTPRSDSHPCMQPSRVPPSVLAPPTPPYWTPCYPHQPSSSNNSHYRLSSLPLHLAPPYLLLAALALPLASKGPLAATPVRPCLTGDSSCWPLPPAPAALEPQGTHQGCQQQQSHQRGCLLYRAVLCWAARPAG